MIHLTVFGYIFVTIVGFVCLVIALILYYKIRSKLLFHFIVYFSALTLFVFFYLLVLTYINTNLLQVSFYVIVSVLFIIIVSYSFLIYSILHFGHYLINKKPSVKKTIFEISVSVISFIGIVSSLRIDWAHNQIDQQMSFGLMLSYALLLFSIVYILIIKQCHKSNVDPEIKQIFRRTSILNIIFIPGFILDFFVIQTFHFALFIPLFYFCYSILFLQYFIKRFNADLISHRSMNDNNDFDNYLSKAGISKREKEIITLIMKGYSNKKISDQLFISLSTVKTHIRNIFQKLNVKSRFEIISRIKSH